MSYVGVRAVAVSEDVLEDVSEDISKSVAGLTLLPT